jgi:hypothetical protein
MKEGEVSGRFFVKKLRKKLLLLGCRAFPTPWTQDKSLLRSFSTEKRPLAWP